jgi:hypothetical protein
MCEEYVCDHMQRIALHLSTAKREPSEQAERNFGDTRSFQSLYHIAFDLQAASITERNPDEQRTVFFFRAWADRPNWLVLLVRSCVVVAVAVAPGQRTFYPPLVGSGAGQ